MAVASRSSGSDWALDMITSQLTGGHNHRERSFELLSSIPRSAAWTSNL